MLSRGMVNLEGKKVKNIDDFWVYVYVLNVQVYNNVVIHAKQRDDKFGEKKSKMTLKI